MDTVSFKSLLQQSLNKNILFPTQCYPSGEEMKMEVWGNNRTEKTIVLKPNKGWLKKAKQIETHEFYFFQHNYELGKRQAHNLIQFK